MFLFYKTQIIKYKVLNLLYFALVYLFLGSNTSNAQLTFNNGMTAQQLAELLAGPGINVSNAIINCDPNGIASFNGSSNLGISNGIILTTGSTSIVSPNNNNTSAGNCNNTSGDVQLNSLISATTYDACVLEFDIIPICDTLRFNFIFGSEEYPEFVNANVNDPFAFFISGPGIIGQSNIALLPNGMNVSIDNVNSTNNAQFFNTNTGTSIEYDGYTTVITASVFVQSCQSYHLKIVVADAGDCYYDSGVFLEAGSVQCQSISASAIVPNASEGCQDGAVEFCRAGSTSAAATVSYMYAGTAISGIDFNTTATTITIPVGQACVTLPIVPIVDGTAESIETVLLIYQPGACAAQDTVEILISDLPVLNAGPDITICSGETGLIGVLNVPGTSYGWIPASGLSDSTISNPSITLINTGLAPQITNYILTATNSGCVSFDTVVVNVNSTTLVDAGPDKIICGGSATLMGIVGGLNSSGIWTGGSGVFSPNDTTLNCIYTPSVLEIDSGSVILTLTSNNSNGACLEGNDQMSITIAPQAIIMAGADVTICNNNTVTLQGFVGGSADSAIWTGGGGTFFPDNTNPTAVYTPSLAEAIAGTVVLTYTPTNAAGNCAEVSDQLIITINQMATANAGSGQYYCAGEIITLQGTVGGSANSGTWSGGTGVFLPNNTTLNAEYMPSAAEILADSVILTLTSNNPVGPCTFSSSNVIFHFYVSPEIDFSADTTTGCPGFCTNFNNLTTIGNNGTIVAWSWDFGDGGAGSALENSSNCFQETGFYDIKLTATTNNGCVTSLTKSQLVEVFNLPTADFSFNPNPASILEPTIFFNNLSTPDVNYWNWNFGDGDSLSPIISNPEHNYSVDSTVNYLVKLIVRNNNGCYDTVVHEIIFKQAFTFFIPNAFSPSDGGGVNDYFFGSGVGISKYNLWIFDRWGDIVFYGDELNKGWNGKVNNGKDVAIMDTYIWKVTLTDILYKEHNFIGKVTLVK